MTLRLALVAAVLLLVELPASASSGGITGYTGKNGVYCAACHGNSDTNARATIIVNGTAPFVHTQTYPVDIKFCTRPPANMTYFAGFDIGVQSGGSGGGGKLSVPMGSTGMALQADEIKHTQRRQMVAVPDGGVPFSTTCTHEVTVRVNWQPPALPANTANPNIRMFAAANWGPQGAGRTTVLTRDLATVTPQMCNTTGMNPLNCGRVVPVQPSTCADADGDGFVVASCWPDPATSGGDCNDTSTTVRPFVEDLCNNVDDDCDGQTDEDAPRQGYLLDLDMDMFGSADAGRYCNAMYAPANVVTQGGDCNDGNANIKPGAMELCDGIDNNCAGGVDEGYTVPSRGQQRAVGQACDSFLDGDQCELGTVVCSSNSSATCMGDVERSETCNNLDDDCDGLTDEDWWVFQNNMRKTTGMPCDSFTDPDFCPNGTVQCTSATSVACMGDVATPEKCTAANSDDDCDGLLDRDDGFAMLGQSCVPGAGCGSGQYVCSADGLSLRCDDTSMPMEICGNGVDDNCDGRTDELSGTWMGLAVGQPCDRLDDMDQCATGIVGCVGGSLGCGGETDAVEACDNGVDDDCDGMTDEMCPDAGHDAGEPDASDAAIASSSSSASSSSEEASSSSSRGRSSSGTLDAGMPDTAVPVVASSSSSSAIPDAGRVRLDSSFNWPDAGDGSDGVVCACDAVPSTDGAASVFLAVAALVMARKRK